MTRSQVLRKGVSALILVTLLPSLARGQALTQPDNEVSTNANQGREQQTSPEASNAAESKVWCCPLHPQVRQAKQGKCPLCGIELVEVRGKTADGTTALMSLEDMLAMALEHNPDVRAANSKLRSAEAELDRTRLEVAQQIIAFRQKRQEQRAAVEATERELAAVERQRKMAEKAGNEPSDALLAAAKEKVAFQRSKLAETEAELPFLLGQVRRPAALQTPSKTDKLIRKELLPKARQILDVLTQEYRAGDATLVDVATAHRQIMDLEFRLADTKKKKVSVVQSQRKLLLELREIAQRRYQGGQGSQSDVLTADLEVSKVDLLLLELKGE